jgi:hypothetical protein
VPVLAADTLGVRVSMDGQDLGMPFGPRRVRVDVQFTEISDLFAVPWLTPSRPTLLGVLVLAILVFGAFALLKSTSGETQAPANELVTGSIPRAVPVREPPSNDQTAAFLSPASTQLTTLVQSTAVDRRAVPLPRPRPKRL